MYRYYGGVRTGVHPDMGIMKVYNDVPCESHLVSKWDVRDNLCIYNEFCESH
jgi:hypothetical protein